VRSWSLAVWGLPACDVESPPRVLLAAKLTFAGTVNPDPPGTSSSLSQSRSESAAATDQAPPFSQEQLDFYFPQDVDMDGEQTTQIQIKNDERLAKRLQAQLDREDEDLLDFELEPQALGGSNGLDRLADLRSRLQRVRCAKCKTRIHVKADDVIKRAREALRESRRSS